MIVHIFYLTELINPVGFMLIVDGDATLGTMDVVRGGNVLKHCYDANCLKNIWVVRIVHIEGGSETR